MEGYPKGISESSTAALSNFSCFLTSYIIQKVIPILHHDSYLRLDIFSSSLKLAFEHDVQFLEILNLMIQYVVEWEGVWFDFL